jgi:hypothetical protein
MYRDERTSSSSDTTTSTASAESPGVLKQQQQQPELLYTDASSHTDAEHEDIASSDDQHDEGAGAGAANLPTGVKDSTSQSTTTTTRRKDTPSERVVVRRKGHFKSRLGCFSCKRRRVKCDESRPSCSPCRRLGLTCEYPTASPAQVAAMSAMSGSACIKSSSSSSSSSSSGVGSSTPLTMAANPALFSLQDLRFYHQFLTVGFPTLPLKAREVWSQCAAMSHQVSPATNECPLSFLSFYMQCIFV